MGTTTDWRPLFVASAASMLRVKASKKWPGWQDAVQEDAAKAACRQAAADIEGIPALRARAEAAEQRAEGWRWFAQEVASDMHPIGADPLGDITTDLLPVLLDITRRAAQQQGADCARAEAAEQRAEAAERELAQARADARMLAVAAHGLDDCCWIDQMQAAGLTEAEADALDALYDRLYDRPDAEVVAAIRRALGGAA